MSLRLTRIHTSFRRVSDLDGSHTMSESINLDGRAAVVTGAGGGLGRAEALALAAAGARVVVNDVGPAAHDVVDEIKAAGGEALAVTGDVGEWALGERLVQAAVGSFGSLDIVVNNAGVLRDTMLFNLTESDWDDVIRVHLKGHASVSRAAAVHWRAASKAAGGPVYGRVVNTSSEAFLFGSAGQPNYSAAKAGITALTLSTSQGLSRYGVRANAICPRARTAMTDHVFGDDPNAENGLDALAPERVATFVRYLASPAADGINGQVFVVYGGMVALMAAPTVERKFEAAGGTFTAEEFAEQMSPYFVGRSPYQTFSAYSVAQLDTTGIKNKVN
jgi:3-oxoacyl-[acyl-carrier protein] reductase